MKNSPVRAEIAARLKRIRDNATAFSPMNESFVRMLNNYTVKNYGQFNIHFYKFAIKNIKSRDVLTAMRII